MISVVIGTFGSEEWRARGEGVLQSLSKQTVKPVSAHHIHSTTLAKARNQGAEEAAGEWLLFVDADDSISDNFIEMAVRKIESLDPNFNYLLRPAAVLVGSGNNRPSVLPVTKIYDRNFMIIGTMLRKELFVEAGMFSELPMYEDWDLWIRCVILGARYACSEGSVYYINQSLGSRNSQNDRIASSTYTHIRRKYQKHFT